MKKCSGCKILKSYGEFYKRTASPDGHGNLCKACSKEYACTEKCKNKRRKRDNKNRSILNKKHNEYVKLNRQKCNEHQKIYYHKYWEKSRAKKNEYESRPERKAANNAKSARRRAKLAISSFAGFSTQINDFYKNCPLGFHVDHIVPLNGEQVSGLHVPWNLQYLPASDNLKKSNKI
jgi:hypothetical protein